jgi:AcrR family transcriptional regulator
VADSPETRVTTTAMPAHAIDGRRLRSERTRQLIIEAYIALLRESPEVPTATQIAARAGYSVRSVFERFDDMMALSLAAAEYAFALGTALGAIGEEIGADADRQTRIRAQVEARAAVCEAWLPLWRALLHNQRESRLLRARANQVRDVMAMRLRTMYRPELSTVPELERQQILIALEALTDFESWGRMRERHGLGVEAARAAWIAAIDRLLPPTP